jgi:hypothetical protein
MEADSVILSATKQIETDAQNECMTNKLHLSDEELA